MSLPVRLSAMIILTKQDMSCCVSAGRKQYVLEEILLPVRTSQVQDDKWVKWSVMRRPPVPTLRGRRREAAALQ